MRLTPFQDLAPLKSRQVPSTISIGSSLRTPVRGFLSRFENVYLTHFLLQNRWERGPGLDCPSPTRSSRNMAEPWSFPMHRSRALSSLLYCRSEEHTSELQSRENLVCRLLLEKKKKP